jgi:peptide/nickel transport system substrate-binding protein
LAVNRDFIVNSVLQGFASPLDSAVPKSFTKEVQSSTTNTSSSPFDDAAKLLDSNGWTMNAQGIREKKIGKDTIPLAFSISTSDSAELKQVAETLKSEWKKLGADVTVKVVESGNLNQNIIKPRKYEGLLFGQVINRDLDLYPFWHSSQQQDPGLNVALYSNKTADKILEDLRKTTDKTAREQEYVMLNNELQKDVPAIFLYTPNFIYVVPPTLHGLDISEISTPSERFGDISSWYTATDHIWKIFLHNK